jgi:hypothetical protein
MRGADQPSLAGFDHITYVVGMAGFVHGDWKLERSAFRGREPDRFRWNFDPVSLDSASTRLSWKPGGKA